VNGSNNNGKKSAEVEKKKGGWNIFGSLKKAANKIMGEDLGDSDAYDKDKA
jgi:hypothetical protein